MKKYILVGGLLIILIAALILGTNSTLFEGKFTFKKLVPTQQLIKETIAESPPKLTRAYKTAVCLIKWTNEQPSFNIEELRTEMRKVSEYYKEVSFNKVNFDFVNFYSTGLWTGSYPATETSEIHEVIEFCDPLVDFSNVDIFITYPGLYASGGLGATYTINSDEGEFRIHAVQIGNYAPATNNLNAHFEKRVIAHELGHSVFDLNFHANGLKCGNSSFNTNREGCLEIEQGNPFDIMGIPTNEGQHFSGWSKYLAKKWVNSKQIIESGTYKLGVLELSSKHPQVLRIPFKNNPVCIDYRKPIGSDTGLAIGSLSVELGPNAGIPRNGCIFVELCSMLGDRQKERILIDTRPNSIPSSDDAPQTELYDACIHEGDVFSNNNLGITSLFFIRSEKNTAGVKIKMSEEKIDDVDLEVTINGGSEVCHFSSGDAEAVIQNISEKHIEEELTIQLFGITTEGEEVLIKTRRLNSVAPGEIIRIEYGDIASYQTIKVVADTLDRIDESDERNNESRFERNCFI